MHQLKILASANELFYEVKSEFPSTQPYFSQSITNIFLLMLAFNLFRIY